MLAEPLEGEIIATARAMATEVTIKIATPGGAHEHDNSDEAVRTALEVFHTVEKACTRFDPTSPLMRANAKLTNSSSASCPRSAEGRGPGIHGFLSFR